MKGIAIFMASVITAGAVGFLAYESEGFKNWNTDTWFGKAPTEQSETEPDKTPEIKDNSLVVTSDANMSVRKLERSAYAANGISEDTYGAYTLSVIVEPVTANVKTATWSVAWQEPDSTWASGKAVSDYVTMNTVSGVSTTISCKDIFAEQIIVTAVSDGNTDLSATCTLDFRKRAEDFKFYENAGGMGYIIPEVYTVDYHDDTDLDIETKKQLSYSFFVSHSYGIGTVDSNAMLEGSSIKVSLSNEFISELQNSGVTVDPYSPPSEAFYNDTTKRYDIGVFTSTINLLASSQAGAGTVNDVCSNSTFWECVQRVDKHITLTYTYQYNGEIEYVCVRYLKLHVSPTGITLDKENITF